jgi:hypothetical protein
MRPSRAAQRSRGPSSSSSPLWSSPRLFPPSRASSSPAPPSAPLSVSPGRQRRERRQLGREWRRALLAGVVVLSSSARRKAHRRERETRHCWPVAWPAGDWTAPATSTSLRPGRDDPTLSHPPTAPTPILPSNPPQSTDTHTHLQTMSEYEGKVRPRPLRVPCLATRLRWRLG